MQVTQRPIAASSSVSKRTSTGPVVVGIRTRSLPEATGMRLYNMKVPVEVRPTDPDAPPANDNRYHDFAGARDFAKRQVSLRDRADPSAIVRPQCRRGHHGVLKILAWRKMRQRRCGCGV